MSDQLRIDTGGKSGSRKKEAENRLTRQKYNLQLIFVVCEDMRYD